MYIYTCLQTKTHSVCSSKVSSKKLVVNLKDTRDKVVDKRMKMSKDFKERNKGKGKAVRFEREKEPAHTFTPPPLPSPPLSGFEDPAHDDRAGSSPAASLPDPRAEDLFQLRD